MASRLSNSRLLRLVRQQAGRLALGEWRITVVERPSATSIVQSQVTLYHDLREARLEVSPRDTEEALRNTITHELLHIALADYTQTAEELADTLPEGERKWLRRELTKLEERVVVRITRALVGVPGERR